MPVLRVDAHFTVVEAALKGYMKWRVVHGSKPQQDVIEVSSHVTLAKLIEPGARSR